MSDNPEGHFLGWYRSVRQCGPTEIATETRRRFNRAALRGFLASDDASVVLAATRCLGLIGLSSDAYSLVALLGHKGPEVAAAAENALWTIWMRGPSERAQSQLAEAIGRVRNEAWPRAIQTLRRLLREEPEFAEAHHQLALCLHSSGDLYGAKEEYAQTARLNPLHFAAIAGHGHLCVELEDYEGALRAYREALRLHPRQAELRELVPRLEVFVQQRVVA